MNRTPRLFYVGYRYRFGRSKNEEVTEWSVAAFDAAEALRIVQEQFGNFMRENYAKGLWDVRAVGGAISPMRCSTRKPLTPHEVEACAIRPHIERP